MSIVVGTDAVVETTSSAPNTPYEANVTALQNGRYLVTWNALNSGAEDVRGRIFEADGTPVSVNGSTSDFLITTTTAFAQIQSTATLLPDGRFVVTWASGDFSLPTEYDIKARVFNADGTPAAVNGSTDEFTVNNTTASYQANPSVVPLTGGGFMVTWHSFETTTGTNYDVRARIFGSSGTASGNDFVINTTTSGEQAGSMAATLADGRVAVVWHSVESGSYEIRGRVLNADGSGFSIGGSTADFRVNTTTANNQVFAAVAALGDGGFAVTWVSDEGATSSDIRVRVYNADGSVRSINGSTNDFVVNTITANSQYQPTIAAREGGGFFVLWASNDDGDATIYGRAFDSQGQPEGAEFVINSTDAGTQAQATIALLSTGLFQAAWYSTDGTGHIRSSSIDLNANAAPSIGNLNGNAFSDTEGGGPVLIASGSTVTDADSPVFDGGTLTVSVSNNRVPADDVLGIAATGGVTTSGSNVLVSGVLVGTFTGGTGTNDLVITFNANASVANVQSVLRATTYFNSNLENPDGSTRTISFTLTDGDGGATTVARTVTITPVNDAPVPTTSAGPTSFTEDGGAVVVDGSLTVTDVDTATLSSARVEITGGYVAGQDTLSFDAALATSYGITGGYANGLLQFTSTPAATLAQWQAVLRTVTYGNGSQAPDTATRTISFTLNDGIQDGPVATKQVTVASVNDPIGTVAPGSVTLDEDAQNFAVTGLSITDADAAGAPNGLYQVTLSDPNGALTLSTITGLTFTAGGNGTGAMTFNGTLANVNAALATLTYTPNANYNGSHQITFQATDEVGGTVATGSGAPTSDGDTINVTVNAVNDAPTVLNGIADQTGLEGAWSFQFPADAFSDLDGDTLTYTAAFPDGTALPSFVQFNGVTRTFSITSGDFAGDLPIRVTASDGTSSTFEDFIVTVQNVNDAPNILALNGNSVTFTEGASSVRIDAGGNAAINDVDSTGYAGGTLTVSIGTGKVAAEDELRIDTSGNVSVSGNQIFVGGLSVGTFTGGGAGGVDLVFSLAGSANPVTVGQILRSIHYANSAGDAPTAGARQINFTLVDGGGTANGGADTGTATATVTVAAVNDAPTVANAISDQSSLEDQAWSFQVPTNAFADVDGDTLTYSATLASGAGLPAWLTFTAATRTFSGTPPADFTGELELRVTVTDGALTAFDDFKITIVSVNDGPFAANDAGTVVEETSTTGNVLTNDLDPEGDPLVVSQVSGAGGTVAAGTAVDGARGRLTLGANGSWTYQAFDSTLAQGESGTDTFTYTISDGNGGTATGQLVVTVQGRNEVVTPSDGDDVKVGGTGDDVFSTGGGDDTVDAGGGNDQVDGGTGNDTLDGGNGNDTLDGGADDDMLYGGAGADQLNGGTGFDWARYDRATEGVALYLGLPAPSTGEAFGDVFSGIEGVVGTNFNDTILGGEGSDLFVGLNGHDVLFGDGGVDALYGANGDDSLFGGALGDYLDGGLGYDFARYDFALAGVTANLSNPGANAGEAAGDIYVSIEGLTGTDFADGLVGDGGANAIYGWAGADTLVGYGGADRLFGGEGADTIFGGEGADALRGDGGADVFVFQSVAEAYTGVDQIEDFTSGVDKIALSKSGFGVGSIDFVAGPGPTAATAQFIYDAASRTLMFDPDGTGAGSTAVPILRLQAGATLLASDFVLF
jgi:VCBS repeat-containing protein